MIEIRAVIFRENDVWVAQCLEHDLGTQANTIEMLHQRLDTTLIATLRENGGSFTTIPETPAYFGSMWQRNDGDINERTIHNTILLKIKYFG